jgi:2-polyprenyl-6-methoxyphenol hydroxylase-like FAD-dependent oxidoreductase
MNSVNRDSVCDVVVVGAGPTGLTLAVDLARRGVSVRVIEKGDPFTGSRGKGLQPRTQEVFEDLGVLDRVRAAGGPYPPVRIYRGAEIVHEGHLDAPREATPAEPYPNVWMLPQFRTAEILRDRLAELGVMVETGVELIGFAQDADGVTATVTRLGQLRTRYLVGADGGRSRVRRELGVSFLGETYETHRALIADVRLSGLDRDLWRVWTDPADRSRMVGLCPLAGTDLFQFTASLAPDATPDPALDDLQRAIDEATGGSGVRLVEVGWTSVYRANIRMVDRYRVGRVLLAGDAAHVHSPAGGQGLNTGVQDAYNLGWKLGLVLAGAPDTLLDTYEQERLPVAAGVLGISTALHHRAVNGDDDALDRNDPRLKQLGVSYRGGPLADERRPAATGITAGDRAPDAPCRDPEGHTVRLFQAFRGPGFTRLAFSGDGRVEVNGRILTDPHGYAHDAYGVAHTPVYAAVRPDGYLGAISTDAADVDRYLTRLHAAAAALS